MSGWVFCVCLCVSFSENVFSLFFVGFSNSIARSVMGTSSPRIAAAQIILGKFP